MCEVVVVVLTHTVIKENATTKSPLCGAQAFMVAMAIENTFTWRRTVRQATGARR